MRLTEWRGEHAAIANHRENYIDKLAAYEDAEEQGRLVILPCKVGDTVYYLTGNPSLASGYHFNRVESTKCIGVYWDREGLQICLYMPHGNHGTYGRYGKTIFLTREEAEAALQGKKYE
jgi:hypothetical protein